MSTSFNLDDETLSAFLDAELPPAQMSAVREALTVNPALSDRLEALALADSLVRKQAHVIDSRPMPESVLKLLQNESQQQKPKAEVISLSLWQRSRQFASTHSAMAAGLVLMLGVAVMYFSQSQNPAMPALADYSETLDTALSGESVIIASETSLRSRFSFQDVNGRYCRQYQLQSAQGTSENVACRDAQDWTLMISAQLPGTADNAEYRPASGQSILDEALDVLMQGGALSLEEEGRLIRSGWESSIDSQ